MGTVDECEGEEDKEDKLLLLEGVDLMVVIELG